MLNASELAKAVGFDPQHSGICIPCIPAVRDGHDKDDLWMGRVYIAADLLYRLARTVSEQTLMMGSGWFADDGVEYQVHYLQFWPSSDGSAHTATAVYTAMRDMPITVPRPVPSGLASIYLARPSKDDPARLVPHEYFYDMVAVVSLGNRSQWEEMRKQASDIARKVQAL